MLLFDGRKNKFSALHVHVHSLPGGDLGLQDLLAERVLDAALDHPLERARAIHLVVPLAHQHAHGTVHLERHSASSQDTITATAALFDRIVDPSLLIRRITIDACHVLRENDRRATPRQLSLFDAQPQTEKDARARERRVQETVLSLKARFGKNILLRATSLEDGATAMQRNAQIGGHKA